MDSYDLIETHASWMILTTKDASFGRKTRLWRERNYKKEREKGRGVRDRLSRSQGCAIRFGKCLLSLSLFLLVSVRAQACRWIIQIYRVNSPVRSTGFAVSIHTYSCINIWYSSIDLCVCVDPSQATSTASTSLLLKY